MLGGCEWVVKMGKDSGGGVMIYDTQPDEMAAWVERQLPVWAGQTIRNHQVQIQPSQTTDLKIDICSYLARDAALVGKGKEQRDAEVKVTWLKLLLLNPGR